jgi:gliding motility-associated-like protein
MIKKITLRFQQTKLFRNFFLLLFTLIISGQVFAQPANDECANASVLNVSTCCVMNAFTTISATASAGAPAPTCGAYTGGDVWFQAVVPASGHIVFETQTSNSSLDPSMSLYTGTCGSLMEINCNDNYGSSVDPLIDASGLTPGTTVYIRYWLNNGGVSNFYICAYSPQIQPPCSNLGFEDGINGWTGTLGNSQTGPAGALTPTYVPAVWCPTIGSDPNFTLVTGGTDPYGGFPKVFSGSASLQISDVATSTEAETYNAASVEQTFLVDATNTKFTFNYAAVVQDGGHPDNIQPFFECEMIDQNGVVFQCTQYIVTVPYPGFIQSGSGTSVYYKPWTSVNVNLTNYIGQNVTARFTASDCEHVNNGAHFGYAYIDCACAPYDIIAPDTICLGQAGTLSAPAGAAGYLWSTGDTSPSITVYPTTDSTFYVTISEIAIDTCTSVLQTFVNVRPFVPPTAASNSPICAGETLHLTSTPGSALSYTWDGPGFASSVQNPDITNATPNASGTYTVTVVKGGCTATATVDVTVNPLPVDSSNSPVCQGGTIYLFTSAVGATSYQWNGPGAFSSNLQNPSIPNATPIYTGIYTVTASPGGCTSTISVTVNPSLQLTGSTVSDVSCYGFANGVTTVACPNGTPPLTYNWSTTPVQTTQNASNLPPGTYYVTVTDANGCSGSTSASIIQPTVLQASITNVHNAICYNGLTGGATASASGGTPGYTYNWSGGTGSGGTVTNLGFGNYYVTISDSHSCDTVLSFHIGQGPQQFLTLTPHNEICQNSCDGSVQAAASGGIPPYTYQWSNSGSTTNLLDDLCVGTYSVTVTDSSHCTIVASANVYTDNIIVANGYASPNDVPENTLVNFFFTGSNAITYHWDFGDGSSSTDQNPTHLYTTTGGPNVTVYTVTLTITNGPCTSVYTFPVTVYIPSEIFIPNIITPNGDGLNDDFRVVSKGLGTENMIIYNRWGKKVFSWVEVGGSWDGKDGSRTFADGTYYYILTAKGEGDFKEYDVHGTVTVLK